MAEAIICAFNVTRRFLGKVCRELVGDGLVEGSVSLKKISDMDYSFEFLSDCGLVMIYADIDDFRVVEGNKFQIVIEEQYVYAIEDRSDYLLFRDAVYECQLLMEVSYHFMLIKSNHYMKLSKLLNLGGGSLRDGDSMISKDDEYQVPECLFNQAKQQYSDPLVILEGVRNIVCVFCKAEKVMEKNLTFALHPYVPVNFENKNIYMCFRCLDNWRQFREEAICDDTLIPLDESNEDLCGICSVSASELFLCSSCPRSFCGPCLEFTLTAQQVVQVKEPYDWVCMCCVAKVGSMSPSAMSSDWCIAVVEHAHLLSNEHEPHLIIQNSSYLQNNELPVMWIEDDSAGSGVMDTIIETSQLQEPMKSYPTSQITIDEKCDREMSQGISDGLSSGCIEFCTSSYRGSKVVRRGEDKMKPLHQVVNIVSEAKTANNFKNKYQHGRGNMDDGTTVVAHSYNRDILLDSGITNELTLKKTKTNLKVKCNEEMKIISTEQISPTQSIEVEMTAATEEAVGAYDALQYFKRYLQDLELCSHEEQTKIGMKKKFPTDDVCFLCKDGGDLLECDYVHRDLPVRRPCQRVYHRHCLPFVVSIRNKNWKCPRHYCDFCGNSRLRYMCKYCPMSACAACSKPGSSSKVIIPSSGSEGHVRFTDNITLITCDSCRSMISRCSRGRGRADTPSSIETTTTSITNRKSSQPLACRPCKKPVAKRKRP